MPGFRSGERPAAGEAGFGVVLVLGIVTMLGTLGLVLATLLLSGHSEAGGALDRTAAYYAAEGGLERAIAETLATLPDWSRFDGDTLFAAVPLDAGACTVSLDSGSVDAVRVTAAADVRGGHERLRLALERAGSGVRWVRIGEPFSMRGS